MSSARGCLALELLGVPVRLECDDPELERRLELCYARLATPHGNGRANGSVALDAALRRAGASWKIQVSGRDACSASDPLAALRTLNHELLQGLMLRARSFFFVHAAVLEWQGRGIVLPGLSRAGKSTLALALLLEGARFLSDELLAFDPARRSARALPRALKIRDECVGYFPELARSFQGTGEGRFLPFAALRPDVLADEVPIAAVIVPRWSEVQELRLEPISRGAALLALAESSLNFGTHRQESLDRLADLVREARTLALAWHEPRAAARAVVRELERP